MEWHTIVTPERPETLFSYKTRFVLLGSCFAQEMALRMNDLWFWVGADAFGPLFNPASVGAALERLDAPSLFEAQDVFPLPAGGYADFWHHSSFARSSASAFLEEANKTLAYASSFFSEAQVVIISLGTSWAFRPVEDSLRQRCPVVANCHKFPAARFERFFMEPEQVFQALAPLIARHPQKQWLFTVSPIRHWGDGAHGNQLSKASLQLGIRQLEQHFPQVSYFPAYEILLDELRDYRFYAQDRFHPSAEAQDYIWQRFLTSYFDDVSQETVVQINKLNQMKKHVPRYPNNEVQQELQQKIAVLREKIAQMIVNVRKNT